MFKSVLIWFDDWRQETAKQSDMAKVDIVVPCYNYGRFLEACVGSVLDQSIVDVRVLIIDDASSDDSLSVANRMATAEPRVSVITHSRNQGHISTYNEGIAWASSDYFLLLSADDLLVQGAIERATRILDANPDVVLTHGSCVEWYSDLPKPKIDRDGSNTWARQNLVQEMCATATNLVYTPTAIARTQTQKRIGWYDPSLPHSGDMEMWLRFAAHGAVARIDAVQAIYRKHLSAMSNSYGSMSDFLQRKKAFDSFFEKYSDLPYEFWSLEARAERVIAEEAFRVGIRHLRRGRIGSAVELFRWSIRVNPQLQYFPHIRQLLQIPGSEGRAWAASLVRNAADKLFWRT
jgi:glycosyltransferase involved in cell wall biosynthesis